MAVGVAQGHLQLGPRPVVRGRAMEAGNAPGKRWENHRGNIWETYGKIWEITVWIEVYGWEKIILKTQWGSVGSFWYFPCLITEGYNSSCGRCDLAVTTPWSFFFTQSGRWHCSLCLCGMSLSLWPGFCCLNCECAMQMLESPVE